MFLWKSGKQNNKFKLDLQNYFTTVDDRYHNNRQGTLLDKYTKSSVSQQTTSEGTTFSQRGWGRNKQLLPYDKNYWELCNALDSYINITQHHIIQKQLPMLMVINKVMTENKI